MEPTKDLSFGEKLAGTTFNSSADSDVDKIKQAAAVFMNAIHDLRKWPGMNAEIVMLDDMLKHAEFTALEAQMLAVKAITWKYSK